MYSRKKNSLKFLIVLIILGLLVINSRNVPSPLRISVTDTVSPALGSYDSLLTSLKRYIPFAGIREESRLLRERIQFLERRMEEVKIVYDENQRLKNLIAFVNSIPYTTIPAQVIGRDPSNWSNSLIVDKGANSGIKPNRAVLSTRGLIGRTVEVGRHSSKILLISDANSKVGVLIRRNRQGGMLVGRPDGKCKMIYIALDSDVTKGDIVVSAGFGTIFPKGVLVGEVVEVGKEPGRLYKFAIVKPSQDLSKLEEVMCIK